MRKALALLLATVACRQNPPPTSAPTARDAAADVVRVTPTDAPPARPALGLGATLMSCSPVRRVEGGAGWTLDMRFTVFNRAREALPLRREGIRISVDSGGEGDLSAPGAVEGATTIGPGAREVVIMHPRFPATQDPPVTVNFAFDSIGGINNPLSFPIPSGP